MLVVNAANIEKDWSWICKHNTFDAEMHNISDKTALLAIQGPLATAILQPLTDIDILNLKYYTFVKESLLVWKMYLRCNRLHRRRGV